MHADRLGDVGGLALRIDHGHVEVVDLTQAVAAQSQRIGERAEAILAGVERALPVVVFARVRVGHDHLGHARAVDDRPLAIAIAVAQLVQHEPLARREPDPEAPVLPGDPPAVDGEAGALGLDDVEGLQVSAERPLTGSVVVALGARDRHHRRLVHQVDHRALDEIHDRDDALDRVGVAVVGEGVAVVADRAHDPRAALEGPPEVPGGERVHLHARDVLFIEAPARDRRTPAGIALDDLLAAKELLEQHGRLAIGLTVVCDRPPPKKPRVGQVDPGLEGLAGLAVQQHEEGDPGRRDPVRVVAQDGRAVGLLETDLGEAQRAGGGARRLGLPHDLAGQGELPRRERVQGMPRPRCGRRLASTAVVRLHHGNARRGSATAAPGATAAASALPSPIRGMP